MDKINFRELYNKQIKINPTDKTKKIPAVNPVEYKKVNNPTEDPNETPKENLDLLRGNKIDIKA